MNISRIKTLVARYRSIVVLRILCLNTTNRHRSALGWGGHGSPSEPSRTLSVTLSAVHGFLKIQNTLAIISYNDRITIILNNEFDKLYQL